MPLMLAGSIESEIAGIGPQSVGRIDAIQYQIVGVGGRAAVTKGQQRSAGRDPLVYGQRGLGQGLGPAGGKIAAQPRVFGGFFADRGGHIGQRGGGRLVAIAQKGIQKRRGPHIIAQRFLFEEDVDRLPQGVIHQLGHFLVDQGIGRCRRQGVVAQSARPLADQRASRRAERRSVSFICGFPSGGPKLITMSSGRVSTSSIRSGSTDKSSAGTLACRRSPDG